MKLGKKKANEGLTSVLGGEVEREDEPQPIPYQRAPEPEPESVNVEVSADVLEKVDQKRYVLVVPKS